jgi:hypothetical protein
MSGNLPNNDNPTSSVLSETSDPHDDLKQEILTELRNRESLKTAILNELTSRKRAQWLTHPIILLLIGFIMTGVLGSWLTSRWQHRQWAREQRELRRSNDIEVKRQLLNDITKGTIQCRAVVDAVLLQQIFTTETEAKPDFQALDDAIKKYRANHQTCYGDIEVLEQTVAIYYRSPQIATLFSDLQGELHGLDFNLNFFLIDYDQDKNIIFTKRDFMKKILETAGTNKKEFTNTLKQLVAVMNSEIQEDITAIGN